LAESDTPHRCKLIGCDEPVLRREGERRYEWLRRRYCSDEHVRLGMGQRAVPTWKTTPRLCKRPECDIEFLPKERGQAYCEHRCSTLDRTLRERPTKQCACGCGPFTQPPKLGGERWEARQFATKACSTRVRRQAAAERKPRVRKKGSSTAPEPVPSRDRVEQRPMFANPVPETTFRPGLVPVVPERPVRTRRVDLRRIRREGPEQESA
jgi:hypothetical protein